MKTVILLSLFALTTVSSAEIVKTAIPNDKCGGICFYWWPKLPTIDGWHQDMEHSFYYKENTQAPNGYTFKNSESVIYAKAMFKPRMPNTKTLEQFISEDHLEFKDTEIKETKSIITSDKNKFISYTFVPENKGNWEQVSYGEEGQYYVIFTLSSRNNSWFKKSLPSYIKFIEKYNENPNN
jgi:hypothetical protein